jgi:phosphatidyl-myo-inositol alpha-mannosyltransferase
MRIALACPYAWDAAGGVQTHVRQLAARLLDRGHRVVVLTPSFDRPEEEHVRSVGRPVRIPYNESVAPVAPWPAGYLLVRDALREFHPDVVHAHEPLVPGPSMFAVLTSPAPTVATFHAYADRARLFDVAAPVLRPVWRRLAVRVAVSDAAASFVTDRFPDDGVRVVPNGADVDLFARSEPATLPEGRRLLFVNRLDRRKGFPVMVESFRLLAGRRQDVLLVVAGDGQDRGSVGELPIDLRARVVMLGAVPHPELPPYHAAADLFCAPATGRESFGIVLVEAMAAGLPVVASDIPGYREVVRDGVEGILVPPRDPHAVVDAVGRVLDDPELARRFAEAGRERARRYSWDAVATDLERVYAEAVGTG